MDTIESIEEWKKLIENEYKHKLLSNVREGITYLEINFNKIIKHNPELGDNLLDNPEDSIKAAEMAITEITEIKMQALFYNLPESQKLLLNDISNQLGKLLYFEGYVMKPTEKYLKCRSAKFECPACGNIINVLMIDDEWREPTKCGCGRKGKFRLLDKDLINFQRFELMEPMNDIPEENKSEKSSRKPVKKKVLISENLTRKDINEKLQSGQKVMIIGWLKLEQIKLKNSLGKSNEFKTNIMANNLKIIENSWDSIKLTTQDKKHIKKMAENKDLLDEFAQSLGPTFEGYEMIRKSLILQHVGGKRILDQNGNLEERETIHILMTGDPGSGKSYLMRRSIVLSPLWNWSHGKGLTGVGLVACVVRDEYGGYTLEVGPLVMSDKGIIGIDEMEKMAKSDYGMMNNAMAEEKTKITKGPIDQELRTRTSILATSNPIHKKFTNKASIISQFEPIPKDIQDRFDAMWPMREKIDLEKLEDKYMARHIDDSEIVKQIWDNEDMRKYIAYTKKLIPILTSPIAKYINEKFRKLSRKTKQDDDFCDNNSQSYRLRGNIMRWAYAHSKFEGVGKEDKENKITMEKESIDFAFSLMRHSFSLLNLISEDGFVNYEDMDEIPNKKEVNRFYVVKETIKKLSEKYDNKVPEDLILKEVQKEFEKFDISDLDKEIQKLKKKGDIFEPKPRQWGFL